VTFAISQLINTMGNSMMLFITHYVTAFNIMTGA
jgi:hypothetical protein